MGWEVEKFELMNPSGLATVFEYELVFSGLDNGRLLSFRGDGLIMPGGQVRLNREQDLGILAQDIGIESLAFFDQLSAVILDRSRGSALQAV